MQSVELPPHVAAFVELVGHKPVTAAELRERCRCSVSAATIRRHLNAGVEAGVLVRELWGSGMRTCYANRRAD